MLNQTSFTSFAVAALLSASGLSGCDNFCPQPECVNSLHITGPLHLDVDTEARLQIIACRNTVCSTVQLDTTVNSHNSVSRDIDMNGEPEFSVSVSRADSSWQLSASFHEQTGGFPLDDDDVFTLKIADTDSNTVLVDIQQTVAFDEIDNCGQTCRRASLSLP